MEARMFLVRHWETEANARHIMQGSGNSPASDRGMRQGEATRLALQGIRFGSVFSGPQWRQKHTAYGIVEPDRIVSEDNRLREQHMAGWEDVPIADLLRDHGESFRAWREGRDCPPGAETHQELRSRVVECFEEIGKQAIADGGDRLVVTSGTPIRAIVGHVLDLTIANWRAIAVHNCSITTLRHKDGDYWQIEALNDTHHLREVGVNTAFV